MRPLVFGFFLTLTVCSSAPCGDLLQEQVSQREDIRLLQEKIDQLQTDLKQRRGRNKECRNFTLEDRFGRCANRTNIQRKSNGLTACFSSMLREQIADHRGRSGARDQSSVPKGSINHPASENPPNHKLRKAEHVVEKGQTTAIAEAWGFQKHHESQQPDKCRTQVGQKLFIHDKELQRSTESFVRLTRS